MFFVKNFWIMFFVILFCYSCFNQKADVNVGLQSHRYLGDSSSATDQTLQLKDAAFYPPYTSGRTRQSYVVWARQAVVSTSHPLASLAGLKVLRKGGNAVDAAVAVSFVLGVVRPQSTGIGGGGFLLFYDPKQKKDQRVVAYDFRERAPMRAYREMYLNRAGQPITFSLGKINLGNASTNGYLAVGVPGLVHGLLQIHRKHGQLSRHDVMNPAIEIAEKGFPVYGRLAEALEARAQLLGAIPSSRKIFFRGKRPLKQGELLVQKDLARSLRLIRDHGARVFYEGAIGQAIVRDMKEFGGLIRLNDLKSYRMKERKPIKGVYRGYHIYSMPPPSSGGVHVVQMLNILEGYQLKKFKYLSAPWAHVLAETMRRAFADRARYLGDPDFVQVPVLGLIAKGYAQKLRQSINLSRATPSKTLKAGQPGSYESPETSHFSIVDAQGRAVSSTQTINTYFGSGVVVRGTGIVLNNEMDDFSIKPGIPNAFGLVGSEANAIAPQKTMLSSMSPTIILNDKQEFEMAVGSPGGPRIINATLLTIINAIDYGWNLADSVHAYRIHHQWLPDKLYFEFLPDATQKELIMKGHQLKKTDAIGRVQAVARSQNGWVGVADTRDDGRPAGY